MRESAIEIVGAGPAGLTAAITVARAGARAIVYERAREPGHRFHGDFQGLENWTMRSDVLEELAGIGVEASFDHVPIYEQKVWEPHGREQVYRSPQPFYYLVRRGSGGGTLDTALARQAEDLGVEIRWGETVHHLSGGIVAGGPRGADAVAVGYLFGTDLADGCYAALDDEVAPGGYAYLLAHGGWATLATCFFRDFHREAVYLERTTELFHDRLRFGMDAPRRFGGAGNFRLPKTAIRGKLLFAGEAAGFQDPLWGFGMRYAMLSGHLAARAWLAGTPELYDRLWKERLSGLIRTATVNRYAHDRLGGNLANRLLARSLARAGESREWLRRRYAPSRFKDLLYPLARRRVGRGEDPASCLDSECDCTWCRCHRQGISEYGQRPGSENGSAT